MNKAYIIFTEKVHDAEAIAAYAAAAAPSVLAAGGKVLIAGPPESTVEGTWHGDTTVVLEFESLDAATSWYHGTAYQTVAPQRHRAATSNVAIFQGFQFAAHQTQI